MIDTRIVDGYDPTSRSMADGYLPSSVFSGLRYTAAPSPVHPNSQRFCEILDELKALHLEKSGGYGSPEDPLHNLRDTESMGIPAWKGALIRLNDKIVRLKNYAQNGTLPFESAEDNCRDAASYAVLVLVLLEEAARKDCQP
jgi:hypothetical protein